MENTIEIRIIGPRGVGKTALGLRIETMLCEMGLGQWVTYDLDESFFVQDVLENNAPAILADTKFVITEVAPKKSLDVPPENL